MKRFSLCACTALVPALLLGAPAFAQDADSGEGLDDIIVTAQKRETKLEKTPMTINVVSGDLVSAQGIGEIKGLAAKVPGLSLNESPGGLSGVAIRGVGTSAGSQVFEQSVGLFVDGVYHPRARQYRDALFDIERVEVVKGSQGVLFGKNTSVGAVAVISKGAGSDTGGYVQGTIEANYGDWGLEGAVDIVNGETFKVRFAGTYEKNKGYVRNFSANRDEPQGDRYVVRMVADWQPTDALKVRAKVQHSRLDQTGNNFEFIANQNVAGLTALGVLDGGLPNYTKYEFTGAAGEAHDYQKGWDPSLEINYDLGNDFSLTSITGYTTFKFNNAFDSDSTPASFLFSEFNEDFDQFTQEIRLTSPSGKALEYIVGGYYLHSKVKYDYLSFYNGFPVLGGLYGTTSQKFNQKENTIAAFGQATWHMSDRLQFNLGGRVTSDKKNANYFKSLLDNLGRPTNLVSVLTTGTGTSRKVKDDTFDFSATLSYNPTETSTLYISGGRGNKGSGFVNQAALANPSPATFLVPLERVTSVEAGFKGRFLDGRAYFSIAAYHMDIKNFQDSFYNSAARAFQVRSLDAKSSGMEMETQFKLADWLTAYGNMAWNPKAKLANGERMQRAPRFTHTLGARFSADASETVGLSGFLQWVHSSSMLHQPASAPGDNWSLPHDLVSARVQLTYKPLDLALFVNATNLTKEVYRTFIFGSPIGMGQVGALNEPRQFTFGLRKTF
jgi:iron complex outermembrane receptor protein